MVVDFFYVWAYLELEVGDFDSSRGLTWNFVQALVNCGGSSCGSLKVRTHEVVTRLERMNGLTKFESPGEDVVVDLTSGWGIPGAFKMCCQYCAVSFVLSVLCCQSKKVQNVNKIDNYDF